MTFTFLPPFSNDLSLKSSIYYSSFEKLSCLIKNFIILSRFYLITKDLKGILLFSSLRGEESAVFDS